MINYTGYSSICQLSFDSVYLGVMVFCLNAALLELDYYCTQECYMSYYFKRSLFFAVCRWPVSLSILAGVSIPVSSTSATILYRDTAIGPAACRNRFNSRFSGEIVSFFISFEKCISYLFRFKRREVSVLLVKREEMLLDAAWLPLSQFAASVC